MNKIYIKKILKISILFLYLFSFSFCKEDIINFNKGGCVYLDKIKEGDEIISFEYTEGYYRAIHTSYTIKSTQSVLLKYLGDSSKDVFMVCVISPSYSQIADSSHSTLKYHIPCSLARQQIRMLNGGTYCIQIVKTLIGDINSADFCKDSLFFNIINSSYIPNLNVIGFSNEQNVCLNKFNSIITLIAAVKNSMSIREDYGNLGIGLSNTKVVMDEIILNCKIGGDIDVNSNDKIICEIPSSIPEGIYSVFYSKGFLESNQCPINLISEFNSINFQGDIQRLYILGGSIKDKEAALIDINFNEPSFVPGQFNLTFSYDNIDENKIIYDNINNQDIGIKLIDYYKNIIDTTCDIIISDNKSIFYLICRAINYKDNVRYSLLIMNDIKIGIDQNEIICSVDKNTVYPKIKIRNNEYDFLIIFEGASSYLDCHQRTDGFLYYSDIKRIRNVCGSCGSNCVSCLNENTCNRCWEGFVLDGNECLLVVDKINYDRFQSFYNFISYEKNCNPNKQLFSLVFNYIIYEGDNYAIDSITNINNVFVKNNNNTFRLNCSIDVNPTYIQSEKYYGYCKNETCNLMAYINCFFYGQSASGEYEIEENSNTNIGKLINKAKIYLNDKIKYREYKIKSIINENNIEVLYSGYKLSYKTVFVCPKNFINITNCNYLKNCNISFYNETSYETLHNCSKELSIPLYNKGCEEFDYILMKDDCNNYINDSIKFKYCSNDDSYYDEDDTHYNLDDYYKSRISFINLFMIFWVLLNVL